MRCLPVLRLSVAAALLALATTGQPGLLAQTAPVKLQETVFGPPVMPGNIVLMMTQVLYNPTGRHYAFRVGTNHFLYDGHEGKEYGVVDMPVLSPDGKHFAYLGRTTEGWILVADGVEIARSDLGISGLAYSPDSTKLAYYIQRRGDPDKGIRDHWHLVFDGKEGPPMLTFDKINFSPDSKHAACVDAGDKFMVIDQKAGPEYEFIYGVVFWNPDGKHVAYGARSSASEQLLVTDGPEGPQILKQLHTLVAFSPDGKHLARVSSTGRNKPATVLLDEKPSQEYPLIQGLPFFSPDSQRLAFVACTLASTPVLRGEAPATRPVKQFALVVDGKAGSSYDGVSAPVFSTDSHHIACVAQISLDKKQMMLDGQPVGAATSNVGTPVFSHDGKKLAFWTSQVGGGSHVVVNGKPGPDLGSNNGAIVFSPDDQHIAYSDHVMGAAAHSAVYLDDKAGAPCPEVVGAPVFSPDSKHLAYVSKGGTKFRLNIDGQASAEYDYVAPGMVFSPDNSLEVLAIREKTMILVKFTP